MEAILLPPPLAEIVALLIVIGIAVIGERFGRLRGVGRDRNLDIAAGFVLTTAILCAVIHALAWCAIPRFLLCVRVLGSILAVLGLVGVWQLIRLMRIAAPRLAAWYRRQDRITRISTWLVAITLLAYLFGALGPATDADSLDYHLGVPLDWILNGRAYARPDWTHARLIGLGEMINLVGLACGSDCLDALFQLAGLLVASIAVTSNATSDRDRLFGWLLVVGSPVMLALIFSEKPLILPVGAMTLAMIILVQRFDSIDTWSLSVALVAAAFAMSCKYTFALSGGVVLIVAMLAAHRSGKSSIAIPIAALAILLLPFQVWIRNFAFYGDPVSPFLERFKAAADPDVVDFAGFLRVCCHEPGAIRFLLLPARMIVPIHPGEYSTSLGVGALAFLLCLRSSASRILVWSAAVTSVLLLGLSQVSPRFFLEPYLWIAAAAVSQDSRFKPLLHSVLAVQCVLVAAAAIYGAATLLPGIVTRNGRASVMSKVASGYDESQWLNKLLPRDAWIVTTLRSHALLERRFIVDDDSLELSRAFRRGGPQFAVVPHPMDEQSDPVLSRCLGASFSGPHQFRTLTRNPMNRGEPYEIEVFRLELDRAGCR